MKEAKAEKVEQERQRTAINSGAALSAEAATAAAAGTAPEVEPGKSAMISFLLAPGEKEKEVSKQQDIAVA